MKIPRLRIQLGQQLRQILDPRDQDVDDFVMPLQPALGQHECGRAGSAIKPLPDILANDQVDRAGFVFQGDERNAPAVAGRCRTSTRPATRTLRPPGHSASRAAGTTRNRSSAGR